LILKKRTVLSVVFVAESFVVENQRFGLESKKFVEVLFSSEKLQSLLWKKT